MSNKLFVSNLEFNITDNQLKEAFQPFNLISCYIPRQQGGKGFAFLTFDNSRSATAAQKALDGNAIVRRRVRVQPHRDTHARTTTASKTRCAQSNFEKEAKSRPFYRHEALARSDDRLAPGRAERDTSEIESDAGSTDSESSWRADDTPPSPEERTSREVITFSPVSQNLCNVTRVLDVTGAGLDDPTKAIWDANRATLQVSLPLTHRLFLFNSHLGQQFLNGCASAFPVAPTLFLCLDHVTKDTASIRAGNDDDGGTSLAINHPLLGDRVAIDTPFLQAVTANDVDPITGKIQDTQPFDLCLYQWNGPAFATYYTPDDHAHNMAAGTDVVAISHLGIADPNTINKTLLYVYGDIPMLYDYAKISQMFFGCDRKCYSFGKVLPSAVGNSNHIFADSSCLFAGSSGCAVVRVGSAANTFCGVHLAGDFVHCTDCLTIQPSVRRCVKHAEAYTGCSNCRKLGCADCQKSSKHLKDSFGYNLAYHIFNPGFILLYARYVLPALPQPIPPHVANYLQLNKDLLTIHKAWVGNHIDQYIA